MKPKKRCLIIFILLLAVYANAAAVFARSSENLIIHHVEQKVNEDNDSYTVEMLISALDINQRPISSLAKENISLTEDEQEVEVTSLEPIVDSPVNVVVMMDNSSHMRGSRLGIAKTAVFDFMGNLFTGDSVAVYAFNTSSDKILPLSSDLKGAQEEFRSTDILAGYDTCLFDATYNAVQEALNLSQGRRAVVVISGGPDSTGSGSVCYEKTVDEIINLALQDDKYLPIYTVGVGENLDGEELEFLAEATGGVYSQSDEDADLTEMLLGVSRRLAYQYLLTYESTADPGTHSLALEVANYSATSKVTLPGLPSKIVIESPEEEEIGEAGVYNIQINIQDRGIPIEALKFTINDDVVQSVDELGEPPFEYEIDFITYAGEFVNLAVVGLDENGDEVAETLLVMDFTIAGDDDGTVTEEVKKGTESADDETEACPEGFVCVGNLQLTRTQLLIIGGAVLALAVAIFLVIFFVNKKKPKKPQESASESLFEEATLDGFALPGSPIGRLTILSSDDPLMVGKEFQLTKSVTTIGRSVSNDIALPKDSAVSRKHLQIVEGKEGVILQEVMKTLSDGTHQPPTYGTYINDRKVTEDTLLHTGDEIGLGHRTKLRFEGPGSPEGDGDSEGVTMDQIQLPDINQADDKTRDG